MLARTWASRRDVATTLWGMWLWVTYCRSVSVPVRVWILATFVLQPFSWQGLPVRTAVSWNPRRLPCSLSPQLWINRFAGERGSLGADLGLSAFGLCDHQPDDGSGGCRISVSSSGVGTDDFRVARKQEARELRQHPGYHSELALPQVPLVLRVLGPAVAPIRAPRLVFSVDGPVVAVVLEF